MATLPDLSGMTREQLEAMIGKLAASKQGKLTLKVSKKGAISVYGFGRWPVTLYRDQWQRLADHGEEIANFADANGALLSTGKDDPRFSGIDGE